jgi:hypothetical protein
MTAVVFLMLRDITGTHTLKIARNDRRQGLLSHRKCVEFIGRKRVTTIGNPNGTKATFVVCLAPDFEPCR